jgi:hypothetical protein
VLPVGKEVVFKIKKDRMYLRVADGDDQKMLTYAVVAEKPANSDTDAQNSTPKSDKPE